MSADQEGRVSADEERRADGDGDGRVSAATTKLASGQMNFNVEEIQEVTLTGPAACVERDHMSPYVWRQADGTLGIMVRAVPTSAMESVDTGTVWYGTGTDGRRFAMTHAPVIAPGPGPEDCGGIEDPTVLRWHDDIVVYYTGVTADHQHGQMLYAVGPSPTELYKKGVALASTKTVGNTKEATVERTVEGKWRLFYEYAHHEQSLIGMAIGLGVAGPWEEVATPLHPREHSWDNWHLSTGPLLLDDPERPVMFYNGATHDARWRIGWVAFDRDCLTVVDRGIEPLITPPPAEDRQATDIAFAASVIVEDDGTIWLYYSLEDQRLFRARVQRS